MNPQKALDGTIFEDSLKVATDLTPPKGEPVKSWVCGLCKMQEFGTGSRVKDAAPLKGEIEYYHWSCLVKWRGWQCS